MKKWVWGLVATLLLTGCVDTKDEFTLNPDGTGKVVHEAVLQKIDLGFDQSGSERQAESRVKKMIKDELEKSEGIEVWRDVSWEPLGDNQVQFKGTAYFPDIHQLKFHNAGVSFNLLNDIQITRDEDELRLLISNQEKEKAPPSDKGQEWTEPALNQKIEEARTQLSKTQMMLSAALSSLRIEKIFHLPGQRLSSSNFQAMDNQTLQITLLGDAVMTLFARFSSSDEWLASVIKKGYDPVKDGPQQPEKVNAVLFGEEANISATFVDVSGPLFDYAQEVTQAKAEYDALLKSLGSVQTQKVDPPLDGQFYLGGARIVFESDQENNVRPFNYDRGFTLSIIGQLPQRALKVKSGEITTAVTDNGQELVSEEEWDRKISFPKVSKDKRKVIFDVKLKVPNKHATQIDQLKGTLIYVTSQDTETIDLGINAFVEGEEGNALNAVIEGLGESQWSTGKEQMDLRLDVPVDTVREIRIYDGQGNPVEFSQGYSSFNDIVTFNLTAAEGGFPEEGRIEVLVHKGLEQFELPFALTDVGLLSR
jgi:hypothetical protein